MTPFNPTAASISVARFVTVELAAQATGLSQKAIRRKIEDGIWIEGSEYRRQIDDGRIYVDMKGYEKWVVKELASKYAKNPCASGSNGKGNGVGKR